MLFHCLHGTDQKTYMWMDGWMGHHLLYLVNDPWAVKVSVLRGLPPAEASGWRAGTQRDLQGYKASLITAVAKEKFLEEAPGKTSIHRELQQNRL